MEVSYPQNIQCLFQKVIETLSLPPVSESDDVFAIELSFVEAVNNALIHGNGRSPDKKVTIEYGCDDKQFQMIITDQGKGFDAGKVPDPTNPENITKDSGRGVLLMESYMDSVEYNARGNQVRMTKKLSGS